MNWETITKKVNEGESLIVIDGIIHDIREFIPKHPGFFFNIFLIIKIKIFFIRRY